MSEKFNENLPTIHKKVLKNFGKKQQMTFFGSRNQHKILNKSNPPFYKWYRRRGTTNTCYNALDIHYRPRQEANKTALIYDSPITGNKSQLTYEELRSKVSKFAGGLKVSGRY